MSRVTRRRPTTAARPQAAAVRRTAGRRRQPEEEIQMAVVAYLRRAGVRFFHVPNGSKASANYRAKLRALGLEPGVPDLIIVTPPPIPAPGRYEAPHFYGAALELKAPKGRASDEQKQWLSDLSALGWATAITYGLDEALAQLRAWGYIE